MRSACGSWDAEWKAHAVGPAPARRTQDLVAGIEYTMDKTASPVHSTDTVEPGHPASAINFATGPT